MGGAPRGPVGVPAVMDVHQGHRPLAARLQSRPHVWTRVRAGGPPAPRPDGNRPARAGGSRLARLIGSGRLVVDPVRMGMAAATTRREGPESVRRAYADALLHLAALSIVAGAIHAVVAPPHLA